MPPRLSAGGRGGDRGVACEREEGGKTLGQIEGGSLRPLLTELPCDVTYFMVVYIH